MFSSRKLNIMRVVFHSSQESLHVRCTFGSTYDSSNRVKFQDSDFTHVDLRANASILYSISK